MPNCARKVVAQDAPSTEARDILRDAAGELDRLDQIVRDLLQYARQRHPNILFGWVLAEDANEAYRLECYLWHAHGGAWAGIAGDAHPSPSEPIPFLGCPDCDE